MAEPAVVLDLNRFAVLEKQIAESERGGLRARWEFGHELLDNPPSGGQRALAEALSISQSEVSHRRRFAQRFPTEKDLINAVNQYGTWHGIVAHGLRGKPSEASEAAAVAPGTFPTLVADPPWRYDNRGTRAAASKHYSTMTIDDLCTLEIDIEGQGTCPVEEVAAENAHLYLWVTNGFLREAFDVVDSWGFTYRTCLTWVKPQIGIGNYFRPRTEHVFFCTKGRLPIAESEREANIIEARRTKHSAKPEAFYDMVERVSPAPYLELFSRRRRLGDWHYWGLEA